MPKLEDSRRLISGYIAPPLARLLLKTPLSPNAVTWIGFLVTLGAAALIATDHIFISGIVVVVAGLFDMLDGALARVKGQVTRFGGVLDSSFDRLSEGALLLALVYVFARDGQTIWSLVSGIALLGSVMVSYIRARVEGLGVQCKAGVFTRPERVIILAAGLLLSAFGDVLLAAIGLLAVLSFYTVIERLVYAWRQLKD
jgi:CDP-diacylglycerol--glycerol-3-phosphate 3-phosphatidyltransferase